MCTTLHYLLSPMVPNVLVMYIQQARSGYIRSGWKSIFSVLSLAAKESSYRSTLPHQAWEIVRRLVDEDMGSLVYDFLDVTRVTDSAFFGYFVWFHSLMLSCVRFCMYGLLGFTRVAESALVGFFCSIRLYSVLSGSVRL